MNEWMNGWTLSSVCVNVHAEILGFWNDLLCPTDRLRRKQLSVGSNDQTIQFYSGTIPVVTTTK